MSSDLVRGLEETRRLFVNEMAEDGDSDWSALFEAMDRASNGNKRTYLRLGFVINPQTPLECLDRAIAKTKEEAGDYLQQQRQKAQVPTLPGEQEES